MGFPLPITGGSPTNDVAIVALAHGDVLECSGTLIAQHAVLTAAHCVTSSQLPDIAIGDTLAGAMRYAAKTAFVHPAFDAQTLDHDIAVVVVEPLALPAYSIAATLVATPGAQIRVVGYGWTVANDTSPPTRRAGTSKIDAIEPLQIVSSASPSQACEGDSGGPALFDAGGGEQIIGVASSGDGACAQFAKHTRVDVHADFVLDAVARTGEGTAGAGARCWYSAQCSIGTCLPARDEPRLSFCAPECSSSGECPSNLECVTVDADRRCVHPTPSPGAEGTNCATNADCASGLCVGAKGGDTRVCTTRCFSDLPGFECPSGETCKPANDGQEACFAEGDGGCQTTRGSGLALVLLAFGYILRGRGKP